MCFARRVCFIFLRVHFCLVGLFIGFVADELVNSSPGSIAACQARTSQSASSTKSKSAKSKSKSTHTSSSTSGRTQLLATGAHFGANSLNRLKVQAAQEERKVVHPGRLKAQPKA